jgi:hypothetical protein
VKKRKKTLKKGKKSQEKHFFCFKTFA